MAVLPLDVTGIAFKASHRPDALRQPTGRISAQLCGIILLQSIMGVFGLSHLMSIVRISNLAVFIIIQRIVYILITAVYALIQIDLQCCCGTTGHLDSYRA